MTALLEVLLEFLLLSTLSRRLVFCLAAAVIIVGAVAIILNLLEPRTP